MVTEKEKENEQIVVRDVESARRRLYGDIDFSQYGNNRAAEPVSAEAAATLATPAFQRYIRPTDDLMPTQRTMSVGYNPQSVVAAPPVQERPKAPAVESPKASPKAAVAENRQVYNSEDLMPSIITMGILKNREEKRTLVSTRQEKKTVLDARAKVMVALYIALVAILAITIIITGVAVSNADKRVKGLESTKGEIVAMVNEQKGTLEVLGNESIIISRASSEQNMVNGGEITKISPVQLKETQIIENNWFDGVCDWISSIFGN